MANKYKVIDELNVNSNKVLVLNKPRDVEDYDTSNIIVNGEKHHYLITHNENWIIVKNGNSFIGEEIEFR